MTGAPQLQGLAEALIKAIRLKPPGGKWQFFPSRTGSPFGSGPFGGGIAILVYIDHAAMNRAAILAYQVFPQFLEGVPLSNVRSLLSRSLQHDFWRFMDRVFPVPQRETLWELTMQEDVASISASIQRETTAMAAPKLWLIPAWRLRVDAHLDAGPWIVASGGASHANSLDVLTAQHNLNGSVFPPVTIAGRCDPVTNNDTWLGVRAREEAQALSRLAQIFGAISVALDLNKSRTFSGAAFPAGLFSIDSHDMVEFRTRGPQFPPILSGAALDAQQVAWIGRLLNEPARSSERSLRMLTCLEYVAAGWQPAGRLGFVHNAIAFDALFGVNGKVNKSIIDGVKQNAASITDIENRIRLLLKIRNSLLHGSASSVEQTSEYISYWDSYGVDPHEDQVHILRTCLHSLVP
jgi:hypothetical protein